MAVLGVDRDIRVKERRGEVIVYGQSSHRKGVMTSYGVPVFT